MTRLLSWVGLAALCALGGGLLAARLLRREEQRPPDTAAVVQRIREAARLESLDVTLYKKIDFAPDPPAAASVWGDLANWVRESVRKPRGRAIVFAEAHLSVDLRKLDEASLRVEGPRVLVVLPRVETQVELRPGETEIIGSNLDSAETAQLFERAKEAFRAQVEADRGLQEKAAESARRSLRALLGSVGRFDVQFVERLPAPLLQ